MPSLPESQLFIEPSDRGASLSGVKRVEGELTGATGATGGPGGPVSPRRSGAVGSSSQRRSLRAAPPVLPLIGAQKDIAYHGQRARHIVNAPERTGIGCWSLNPYVGCAFACAYCYARYAHRYVMERHGGAMDGGAASGRGDDVGGDELVMLERGRDANVVVGGGPRARDDDASPDTPLDAPRSTLGAPPNTPMPSWLAFERRIIVKQNAPDLVRQLLRAGGTRYSGLLRGESLVIGTATDPYQPAERRYRITRGVLEVLAEATGLSIVIITKSPLVTRDVDVLARISARSRLTVHVSLITLDRDLARRIEPRSPTPESRLRAITRLHEAGIDVGVNCMPVLPGITDRPADLEALVRSVAAAGAQHIGAGSLRLRSTARERYLPFLSAEFPELAERYRAAYAHGHQASDRYRAGLRRFMRDLCARYGIAIREYQQDDVEDVEEDASSDEQRVASGEAPAAAEAQGLVVFRRTPKRVKERVHAAVMETPQLGLAL